MRHAPQTQLPPLSEEVCTLLRNQRMKRDFRVKSYIENKISTLNAYMRQHKLKTCVLGVSGGIDSAVVLALLTRAKAQPNSPINQIHCLLIPQTGTGMTNVKQSLSRGHEVCDKYGAQFTTVELAKPIYEIRHQMTLIESNWAVGQLVSYMRTPILYYTASLFTEYGEPAIVMGTTNLDEGGYIGYFGKASDGMVDVQMISDIHKSEVYQVAKQLGVPQQVIDATPSGDMFDGRNDEEVFGTSYNFVELYTHYLRDKSIVANLSSRGVAEFNQHAAAIEQLHKHNLHKYLAKSPAIHLDVIPCGVPGGWNNENTPLNGHAQVNIELLSDNPISCVAYPKAVNGIVIDNLISRGEADRIVSELKTKDDLWQRVGRDGYKMQDGSVVYEGVVGSYRLSTFQEYIAQALWERIKNTTPESLWEQSVNGVTWKAVGLAPLLRFVKYTRSGVLLPHYDSPYEYSPTTQTMKSVVIYLTDGGATRFIKDERAAHNFADWDITLEDNHPLIQYFAPGLKGRALIFDHKTLHDSPTYQLPIDKIIIRTDVIYESV